MPWTELSIEKRYIARLTDEERRDLQKPVSTGKAAAYKIKHANILLKVDANGPNWTDERTAQAFSCHANTVANVRRRFVERGMEATLGRKKRKGIPRVVDGEVEARIIALRCSPLPPVMCVGRCGCWPKELWSWTSSRLFPTRRCVRCLKNKLKPHLKEYYVIPPERNAASVAHMEDVLETYHQSYDPKKPAVCMEC